MCSRLVELCQLVVEVHIRGRQTFSPLLAFKVLLRLLEFLGLFRPLGKWIPGWMVDVDKDCEAISGVRKCCHIHGMQIKQVCPNFVSGIEYYGKNVTYK